MILFKTAITNIGSEAEEFISENMIILFGENAPQELREICYTIKIEPIYDTLKPGMHLKINNISFLITAIGYAAEENLKNLGHITINFDGSTTAALSGTIYVEKKPIPAICIGDTISIVSETIVQ